MSALSLAAAPSPETDLDVGTLTLVSARRTIPHLRVKITSAITDGTLDRTMDGASTLTLVVNDPKRQLLHSDVFSYRLDITLNGYPFRLVQVQKSGDDFTLTFEDLPVALLREKKGARHASRSKVTRAEFARSLVQELHPPPPFVSPHLHQTQAIAGVSDSRKNAKAQPYQFQRGGQNGKEETSWDCLQRLATEVGWRCFVNQGTVYFVSETDLLAAAKGLELRETDPAVLGVDFDIDAGKARNEATLTAIGARWSTDPGSRVRLDKLGPANGDWLVHSVSRGLFDPTATITLKRASKPLPEPAPQIVTVPTTKSRKLVAARLTSSADKNVPKDVLDAYNMAAAIDAKRYPYVWGGGHSEAGKPSGGGFDCSGSVVAILAAGHMGFHIGGPTSVSGQLESWGVAGRGQWMTVYASAIHTFIFFTNVGHKGNEHFGTGRWGKSWGGAGFNPTLHPTGGFTARHWPGT